MMKMKLALRCGATKNLSSVTRRKQVTRGIQNGARELRLRRNKDATIVTRGTTRRIALNSTRVKTSSMSKSFRVSRSFKGELCTPTKASWGLNEAEETSSDEETNKNKSCFIAGDSIVSYSHLRQLCDDPHDDECTL